MGLHLMVKIGAKIYEVQVAPVKFVNIYQAAFQKGDTVEMIGAKIKFQGVDAILPREIKDGDYDLVYRDEKGKPIGNGHHAASLRTGSISSPRLGDLR